MTKVTIEKLLNVLNIKSQVKEILSNITNFDLSVMA